MKDYIEHDGIVVKRDQNTVTVAITATSACAGCHAKEACNMGEKKEKIIDIKGSYDVMVGEKVTVIMQKSLSTPAVFLGYILPLVIMVIALFTMVLLSVPEPLAGIGSILVLLPYFILLRLFRHRIDKKFTFALKF